MTYIIAYNPDQLYNIVNGRINSRFRLIGNTKGLHYPVVVKIDELTETYELSQYKPVTDYPKDHIETVTKYHPSHIGKISLWDKLKYNLIRLSLIVRS